MTISLKKTSKKSCKIERISSLALEYFINLFRKIIGILDPDLSQGGIEIIGFLVLKVLRETIGNKEIGPDHKTTKELVYKEEDNSLIKKEIWAEKILRKDQSK